MRPSGWPRSSAPASASWRSCLPTANGTCPRLCSTSRTELQDIRQARTRSRCGLFVLAGKLTKGACAMENRNQNGQPEIPPPAVRIALVTGGNRGIGMEIARQLSLAGLTVLIGCRDEAKGKAAAEQLGKEGAPVYPEVVDVSSPSSIDALMGRIKERYGRLDVLVNNAGIILDRGVPVLEVEDSVVRQTLETNF